MTNVSSNIILAVAWGLATIIFLKRFGVDKKMKEAVEELIIVEELEDPEEKTDEPDLPPLTLEEKIELVHFKNDDLTFLTLSLSHQLKAIDKVEQCFMAIINNEDPSEFRDVRNMLIGIKINIISNTADVVKHCLKAGGDKGNVTWEMLDQEDIKTKLEKNDINLKTAQELLEETIGRVSRKKEFRETFNV